MAEKENINIPDCPKCGSSKTFTHIYGLVSYSVFVENPRVRFEGCVIDEDSHDFSCGKCKFKWNSLEAALS